MTRSKSPFESTLFSKIYAYSYYQPASGYFLSKKIYGYTSKSNYILKQIHKNSKYFRKVTRKSWSHPKYKSKPEPLIDYIFHQVSLEGDKKFISHQRKLLITFFSSKQIREMVGKSGIINNTQDIITLIAMQLSAIRIVKKVYLQKIPSLQTKGLNIHNIKLFCENLEKRIRIKDKHLPNTLHITDFIDLSPDLKGVYPAISDNVINKIIYYYPLSRHIAGIVENVIIINDMIWQYKTKGFNFK